MKPVIPAEEAYDLPKTWGISSKEPFSNKVVKRVDSNPGTLGALLSYVEEAGTSRLPGNEVSKTSVNVRPAAKHDPWS